MGNRMAAILLAAILLLLGSACAGGAPGPTAEQVAEAALAAGAELASYQFTMDMDMTVTGETPGTMTMNMNGAVDEAEGRMRADIQASTTMTGQQIEMEIETYIVGGWVYINMEMPGLPPEMSGWMKAPMPEDYWEQQDIAHQQLDLLRDFIEVELLGTEMVRDVKCYKLRVTPDMAKLWAWAQMQGGMEELAPGLAPEEIISEFSLVQWVATDAYFPVKGMVDMTMRVEAATIGMTATMLIYHTNEPVAIELPPEATDAVEVPMP